jgi:hypothetical protein
MFAWAMFLVGVESKFRWHHPCACLSAQARKIFRISRASAELRNRRRLDFRLALDFLQKPIVQHHRAISLPAEAQILQNQKNQLHLNE